MNLVTLAAWCGAFFLATTLFSHTVALRLMLLFAGFLLAAAAAVQARLRNSNAGLTFLPSLLWPFAAWAAWAALSMLWSLDPEVTGKELRNEIGYAFLALYLCFVGAQAANAARIFVSALALGAFAVCALALWNFWFGPPAFAAWPYSGPGTYSSTLLLLFPCTLAFIWLAVRKQWPSGYTAAGVALLALYLLSGYATQNRTLWIGFMAQIGIAALFLLLRPVQGSAPGWRTRFLIVSVTTLALAGAAATGMKVHDERISSASSPALAKDPRQSLWKFTWQQIEERPWIGAGFGRGILRRESRNELKNAQLWHSHNQFFDTALQLGAVGVVLLLVLLGWTIRLAWRLVRSVDDVAAACGVALLAVVAGMVIRNMTDVLWVRQSALLYWGMVGALLGWGTRAAARRD